MKPVPYISQIDDAPRRNDCGPACALMLARWVGRGEGWSVTRLSERFDAAQDGTTTLDVRAMLTVMGCAPSSTRIYPHAALVSYPALPVRYDLAFSGLHWIVRLSDETYHDPLWPGTRGAFLRAARETLDGATRGVVSILETPSSEVLVKTGIVKSDDTFLRVRAGAGTTAAIVACLRNGATVGITQEAKDVKGRTWYRVSVPAGGAYQDEALTKPVDVELGWCAGWLIALDAPVTPAPVTPQPVPAVPNVLGVNCIANHHILASYVQHGCRAFQVLDNVPTASALADAGHIVVHRHYVPWRMDGAALANWAREGWPSKRVILELLNEQDHGYNYDTPEALNARLDVELDAASRLLAEGYKVCLGGYSMGCPEIVGERGAQICAVLKRRVAPMYNSNPDVYFSMHLYSPRLERLVLTRALSVEDVASAPPIADMESVQVRVGRDQHVATVGRVPASGAASGAAPGAREARTLPASFAETDWYETRWRFMFWGCGFDPAARDAAGRGKIWASETGVDEGGVGGFPAHGYSAARVDEWCAGWRALQAQDIAVDGKVYPSPVLGGAIFQAGNNTDWKGYQIDGYVPAIYAGLGWQ